MSIMEEVPATAEPIATGYAENGASSMLMICERRQISRKVRQSRQAPQRNHGRQFWRIPALAALTFRNYFRGGAIYYGISDLAALVEGTHKFEAHYLDWLVGSYSKERPLFRARSPIFHANRASAPIIFFQGDRDQIVPPDQTEGMVKALRRKRTKVGYLLFSGEDHGFRRADNIQRSLEAELYFYSFEVFGTNLNFWTRLFALASLEFAKSQLGPAI